MRRLLPLLLLLAAPALCWATSSASEAPARQDACEYTRSQEPEATADTDPQQVRPASTPAASRTTSKPVVSGGGNDVEDATPRVRNLRWHSFLPGMFR